MPSNPWPVKQFTVWGNLYGEFLLTNAGKFKPVNSWEWFENTGYWKILYDGSNVFIKEYFVDQNITSA